MTLTHPHFYDAANPANIASGVLAAVYVNGFKWSQFDIDRMARVFRVSVEREASWAEWARCIDIESGAAEPEDAVPFLLARRYTHQRDDETAYVNRSNWPDVAERVRVHNDQNPDRRITPRYWVATLDGTFELPGAWAVQGQGGGNALFDLSRLLGVDDLHRPDHP